MSELWQRLHNRRIKSGEYQLELHQYRNGRPAVLVYGSTGEPECRLTVNLEDASLGDDEFHVRFEDRQFSEPVFQALIDEGLAHPTGRVVSAGYVERYAEVWKLAPA